MAKEKEQFSDKVRFVSLAEIHWDKRYREDFGNIEELAESIRAQGVLQPITVSTDMLLLAGHRRVLAAKAAGLEKIPALIRKIEGEVDLREIELMENVFRKNFTWVEECALIQQIDKLYKEKFKGTPDPWSQRKTASLLNKSTANVSRALSLANFVGILPELADLKTADEALRVMRKHEERVIVEELRRRQDHSPLTKGIEVMLRQAKANYIVGDIFEELAELADERIIHIIECDPPYGIALNETKRGKESPTATVRNYNEIPADKYVEFLEKLSKELYRIAGKDCWMLFWFGPTWFTEVKAALMKGGWDVDDIPGIWVKPGGQTMQPEYYLARAYEPFFICRKGKPLILKRGRSNVFQFSPVAGQSKEHATERPLELMQELLATFAIDMQTVFIPFLGSGVTLRAAYRQGMRGFGVDISPDYKDQFLLNIEADAKALNNDNEDS